MIIGDDAVVSKLAADLDMKVLRGKLTASNIANVDSPGYKAKDLKFHRILAESLEDEESILKQTHVKYMTTTGMTETPGSE